MGEIFLPFILWIESIATNVSLEAFVVVGAFLEELLAPIPSPFVMTTAAVLAQVQGYSVLQLGFLVAIASVAKTTSCYCVYVVSDKAEDIVIGRYGKYFGISHKHVERLGRLLTKTWFDDVLLFLSRAIPVVPTFPISVGAGVIKYSVRGFLVATFLGTVVRNVFYLWIAYFGWSHFQSLRDQLWNHPVWLVSGGVLLVVILVVVLKAKDSLWETFLERNSK